MSTSSTRTADVPAQPTAGGLLDQPERLAFTPREVATAIGVPYRRVLDAIRSGELKARRVGGDGAQRFVVARESVEDYLRATG